MSPVKLTAKTITFEWKSALAAIALISGSIGSVYAIQYDHSQDISALELEVTKEIAQVKAEVEGHSSQLTLISADIGIIKRHILNANNNRR